MPRPTSTSAYFALTFALAWTVWLAAAALTSSLASSPLRELLFLPGTFAPGMVALWLTWRADGRAGVDALLDRLWIANVGVRWYVFAVAYIAVAKLATALAHRMLLGAWPMFGTTAWYVMLAAIPFSTPVQAGEELGWRGYALPRLSARFGMGPASVLLGLVWAVWHLPLFYIPNTDTTGQPFLPYAVAVTALSVAMAWLWGHTRGSLLLVMLMHAAINNTAGVVPSAVVADGSPTALSASPVAWLTGVVLWIPAMYFSWRMPRISDTSPRTPTSARAPSISGA